jgi:hypothetical protein
MSPQEHRPAPLFRDPSSLDSMIPYQPALVTVSPELRISRVGPTRELSIDTCVLTLLVAQTIYPLPHLFRRKIVS